MLNCKDDAALVHAQAAVAAGIATATATNPIWVVKTRLQLDASRTKAADNDVVATRRHKNNSSLNCVRLILRREGIGGLYRGLSASYLGTAETVLHLVLYERLKSLSHRRALGGTNARDDERAWDGLARWVGTSGGFAYLPSRGMLLLPPLFLSPCLTWQQVVRTRLRQAPMENGVPKYSGLLQCFRSVGRSEGLSGLYGGLTAHMMRSIPSAIITLGVYEFVLSLAGY